MKLLHLRTHEGGYWHSHPGHGVFALVAGILLALLIVLLLVPTAR